MLSIVSFFTTDKNPRISKLDNLGIFRSFTVVAKCYISYPLCWINNNNILKYFLNTGAKFWLIE